VGNGIMARERFEKEREKGDCFLVVGLSKSLGEMGWDGCRRYGLLMRENMI
jgi:hypothetical protein